MSANALKAAPRAPKAPDVQDVRELWTPCAVPPLELETPAAWQPILAEWNANSARLRWETLTATPLELSWIWRDKSEDHAREQKRLEEAWKREAGAAESQAKKLKIPFEWQNERRGLQGFANIAADGFVREYTWDGRAGCLFVLVLSHGARRVYASGSLCPPPRPKQPAGKGEKRSEKDKPLEPAAVTRRILKSLRAAGPDEPLRMTIGAFAAELPAGFKLESLKAGDGQMYADARSATRRVVIARVGFADLRLHLAPGEKIFANLAKTLFDRHESPDPVTGAGNPFGPSARKAEEPPLKPGATEAKRHEASLYEERRRIHIRFGDWVLRKSGRKWSGGAAVLAWVCPESRSIWALCARAGADEHLAEARARLEQLACHGRANQGALDWRGFIADETTEPPAGKPARQEQKKEEPKGKEAPPEDTNPIAMRRRQLRFRVRTRPEVRMEPSSKDGTADLVYEGAPAQGFLARMLRGRAQPEVLHRRLSLDPMGRRIWELLSEGRGLSVGELLAELSGTYHVHPVELFPKLLTFMRLLGERRLVEGVPEK